MKVLYIGLYGIGQTSQMRGELLKQILHPDGFDVINIEIPIKRYSRIFRSIAFRYKIGPVVSGVNAYVINGVGEKHFDLIWVDKAIYLTESTTKLLRSRAGRLIHFTPDPAFTYHKSTHFEKSLKYYDFVVTTKSYEIEYYEKVLPKEKVIKVTQGYNPEIHKPYFDFAEKSGVVMIGHFEKYRAEIVQKLIDNGIIVKLAGINWERFAGENKQNPNLRYLGKGIFSEEYGKTISSALFGLGFLSKVVAEKHTTRTFEIPACGTALITERTDEIMQFYTDNDVIYFNELSEIPELVHRYSSNKAKLELLTQNGQEAVKSGAVDYRSILEKILRITETA